MTLIVSAAAIVPTILLAGMVLRLRRRLRSLERRLDLEGQIIDLEQRVDAMERDSDDGGQRKLWRIVGLAPLSWAVSEARDHPLVTSAVVAVGATVMSLFSPEAAPPRRPYRVPPAIAEQAEATVIPFPSQQEVDRVTDATVMALPSTTTPPPALPAPTTTTTTTTVPTTTTAPTTTTVPTTTTAPTTTTVPTTTQPAEVDAPPDSTIGELLDDLGLGVCVVIDLDVVGLVEARVAC